MTFAPREKEVNKFTTAITLIINLFIPRPNWKFMGVCCWNHSDWTNCCQEQNETFLLSMMTTTMAATNYIAIPQLQKCNLACTLGNLDHSQPTWTSVPIPSPYIPPLSTCNPACTQDDSENSQYPATLRHIESWTIDLELELYDIRENVIFVDLKKNLAIIHFSPSLWVLVVNFRGKEHQHGNPKG